MVAVKNLSAASLFSVKDWVVLGRQIPMARYQVSEGSITDSLASHRWRYRNWVEYVFVLPFNLRLSHDSNPTLIPWLRPQANTIHPPLTHPNSVNPGLGHQRMQSLHHWSPPGGARNNRPHSWVPRQARSARREYNPDCHGRDVQGEY